MKIKRLIAFTVLTTLTLTSTLFALTPEQKVKFDTKNKAMIEQVIKVNPTDKLNFKDSYGNLISVDVKAPWGPKGNQYKSHHKSEKLWVTKEGYKREDIVTKSGDTNIILTPDKVTQVFMGSLVLPEGTPRNDWWIALRKEAAKDDEAPLFILKVKEDGSFKALNVPKGNYNVEVYQGKNNVDYAKGKKATEKTLVYPKIKLEVKGNVNKIFDFSQVAPMTQVTIKDYFNELDYSDPSKYLNITPNIEMSADMKKVADKFNDKKDLSTLKQIYGIIFDLYKNRPDNIGGYSTRDGLTAQQIFESGWADNCSEAETVFEAFAKYKGIPTISIESLSTMWASDLQENNVNLVAGHVMAEMFIDGKWILVDTSNGDYYADYDRDNPLLETTSSGYAINGKKDINYLFWKGIDLSMVNKNWKSEQRELGKVFDMSILEITTPNKVSGNLQR